VGTEPGQVTPVPDEVRDLISGRPVVGEMEQAFVLLTASADGPIDVCLLSRAELVTTASAVRLVVRSRKARTNLGDTGRATLVAVRGDTAHYLALQLLRTLDDGGAVAAELEVVRHLTDSLGVELRPLLFKVEPRLATDERWDRTARLLDRLQAQSAGLPSPPR
ncbi:MAG: hypothetical protein ACRDYZ_07370, partial [Acidimicrobiales bacterium]